MIAERVLGAAILWSHLFEGSGPATTICAKFKTAEQQLL
jgi:hypothetical protein